MSTKKNKKITGKHILIILAAFCLLATLLLVKIIHYQGFVPDWDEAEHLIMSYYYYAAFNSKSLKVIFDLFVNSNTIYPPLYHILISVSYRFIHSWPYAAIFTNIPFILILMLSVYGIGDQLGNKKAGLLAALITPILPIFLTVQEKAAIDYPSASVFIASFYLLFKTEKFTNRKYSVFFGLSIFVGLLIKWPFVIPSIPFVLYAVSSICSHRGKVKPVVINIAIVLLISLPALSWYIFNYNYLVTNLSFFWNPNGFAQILWANPHGFNIKNLLLYSFNSPVEPAGVGIIVLIFFYLSLFKPRKSYKECLLLASIAITYLVLTFLDDKSSLYMIYAYPLAMVFVINALFGIKNRVIRNIAICTLVSAVVLNFVLTQLNYIEREQIIFWTYSNYSVSLLPNYDTKFIYGDWPTFDIVNYAYGVGDCSGNILVFPDRRFLNTSTVNFYVVSKGLNYFALPAYQYYNPATDKTFDLKRLADFGCVISMVGYPGTFANTTVLNYVNNYLLLNSEYKTTTFAAPDGSSIFLFIKNE
jgi:hypothetical protein